MPGVLWRPGAAGQGALGLSRPSNAEGGDEGKRRAFDLTRQAIAYRMLQLLLLPLETLSKPDLQAALNAIAKS